MNDENINDYLPSLLNPRSIRKNKDISLTQISTISRSSLSLKRNSAIINTKNDINIINKENLHNNINCLPKKAHNVAKEKTISDEISLGLSAVEDLNSINNDNCTSFDYDPLKLHALNKDTNKNNSLVSPTTDIYDANSDKTILYDIHEKPVVSLSFSVSNCDKVNISSAKSNIKKVLVTQNENDIDVDCDILEGSDLSEESMNNTTNNITMTNSLINAYKRKAVSVNLEIKKQKLTGTEEKTELPRILILNTNAIEKLTHVIIQPPNFKIVKRKIHDINNFVNSNEKSPYVSVIKHGQNVKNELIKKDPDKVIKSEKTSVVNNIIEETGPDSSGNEVGTVRLNNQIVRFINGVVRDDAREMNRNPGVTNLIGRTSHNTFHVTTGSPRISLPLSPSLGREVKNSVSDAQRASSSRSKKDSVGSLSPRRNIDSIRFALPVKFDTCSNKTALATKTVPHHKIIAGTHFAVDAFSYGEIPNVKHYFLTHFHSDHYMGLNRNFNKMLFCSKITADLCILRLGVSFKRVHIINLDESITIDGIEVTAVDANHCPGALMFVFTLPNGKTILHTGDFRASDYMESYPVFWNKDIHTIYLDTTYCHPRFDFPKQDQSLEMALNILRDKKTAIEKQGKKFSSVLIICGTYTIGKEKFFHGLARRVGCNIWTCPDKDQILQAVEGKSLNQFPPQSCQLHVVPMKDITHEKMVRYLANLNDTFSELVAFKPSGWESGKMPMEMDSVTIHGVPYSEHSSFMELIRFVNFLKPKQIIPTVYIAGGIKAVQKYFPCPLISKEDIHCQSRMTDYFPLKKEQQVTAVT